MSPKFLLSSAALLLLAACTAETKRGTSENEQGATPSDTDLSTPTDTNQKPSDKPVDSCTAQTQAVKTIPLHLVVVLDASGSMNAQYKDANGSYIQRFDAVKNALSSFAAAPQAAGSLFMSVITFGPTTSTPGATSTNLCDAGFYQTPSIRDTALPNASAIRSGLAGIEMRSEFMTPTAGGVLGATAYARRLKAQFPNDNVVLVLATDGQPTQCGGGFSGPTDMEAAITSVTEAKTKGFATYVIGVGSSLTELNKLAVAGGTRSALIIDGNSAATVNQKLNEKLEDIRSSFSCDLTIPAVFPNGAPADKSQINVQITSGAGEVSSLVYSQDCSKANAFKYDNATTPTKVVLCDSTCSAVRADKGAKQDLLLGCPSRVN